MASLLSVQIPSNERVCIQIKCMGEESIARKTVRTSFWGSIEKVGSLGTQFVVSMLLARLLSPSDYGVVAMLMVFLAIANQFVSCGFANALIRKVECKSVDYSTAFYFNIAVSILCYLCLFIIAPYVAQFYKMSLLCPVMRVTALLIPLGALTLVQDAILQRNLEAKKNAFITTSTSIIGGFFAVLLAYRGWGVWALVFYQLISLILRGVFLWTRTSWLPKVEFSVASMRYLWGFGSKMLLTGIISVTYSNIYSILIGRFFNSSILGIFNRGQHIAILFPNVIDGIFARNSLPIMSQLQQNKEKLSHVYNEFIKLTCFLTFPIVTITIILAKPFVEFVLTDKWLECVVYIQLFSINSIFSPANSVNLNLLQALGRSDYTLKSEIIKKSIGLIMVFVLLPFGPLYLAVGYNVLGLFCVGVNCYYAKKLSGFSYWYQIKGILPILSSCIIMGFVVFLSISFTDYSLLKLIVGIFTAIISYYIITYYALKLPMAERILNLLKNING